MPATDRSRPAPVLALDLLGTYLRTAIVEADSMLGDRTRTRDHLGATDAVPGTTVGQLDATHADHRARGGQTPARDRATARAFRVQAACAHTVPAALVDDVSRVGSLPLVVSGV